MVFQKKNRLLQVLTLSSVLALAGCGDSTDDNESSSNTTVSGSIFASYVNGASVSVYDENDQVIAGPVTTDANGRYSATIPAAYLTSPLRVVSTGGTFTDEATGDVGVVAGEMSAYVEADSLSLNGEVHATPGSTIMHHLRHQYALTKSEAEDAFETAFGYLPDFSIEPVDPRNSGMATTDALVAGLRAARFSQLTADLTLTPAQQFAMLAALAHDLSDGVLNGIDASGAVQLPDLNNMPTDAGTHFNNTRENFGISVKRSENYRFAYQPGMMPAMEGKTMFKVAVTDLATGTAPLSGLTLTISAKMFMATKIHATPVGGCSEDGITGIYDCTIFYLMPTAMMGNHMGDWELAVSAGTAADTVHFYPPVGMGMNGNGKKKLTAQETGTTTVDGLEVFTFTDYYMMMPTKARPYFMFKNAITGATDDRTVSIFAAMQESMELFPALTTGTIELAFSTNGSSWTVMNDDSNGYWSLAALSDVAAAKFYVRLTVNGEVKINGGFSNNLGDCEVSDVVDNEVPLCNGYATFEQTLP